MTKRVRLAAPAKVNLTLEVLGRRRRRAGAAEHPEFHARNRPQETFEPIPPIVL